jgi:hypothetical protein
VEEEVDNVDLSVEGEGGGRRGGGHHGGGGRGRRRERACDIKICYLIDFVKQKLDRITNLQDHALFTGFNTSFLLPVMDFSNLVPNSIYHTDDLNHNTFSERMSNGRPLIDQGLRQVFIFNMEDNSFTNILYPNSSKLNWPPPIWFQPSLS